MQRARIVAAITELVRERGAANVTVAHIVARSGVSRRTFYELFADREHCLRAAFDHAARRARAKVQTACADADGDWLEQVRAGLNALLRFLDEEPAMGGLLVVDSLGADQHLLERRSQVVAELVHAVDGGGRSSRSGRRPERIVAEGAVGAVLSVLHARLSQSRKASEKPLLGLLSPLMSIVVLPYLGPATAEREARRASPRRSARTQARTADPLRDLQMRLTYRTVRVLAAIAEQPGASGRQIAQASGITDQGQVSKLLWRLEHLGLIRNTVTPRGKGEPNAWALTPKGTQIQQAISTQADD